MIKIANKNSRQFVQSKIEFKGNNLYAVNKSNLYIVYSYGDHWPLFIYDYVTNVWYENEDKYSVSTSKHKSQYRPLVDKEKRSSDWMIKYIMGITK